MKVIMLNNGECPQSTDLVRSGQRLHVRTAGTGPALLLLHSAWGDAEMRQAAALRKWLGSAEFVSIGGAGHMPQVERPE